MRRIQNKVVLNNLNNAILCCEYASSLLNLSTFSKKLITFFAEIKEEISTNFFYVYPSTKLDYRYTLKVREGLYITNPERTICDMIVNECEYRLIEQSLEKYILTNENIDELLSVAKVYNVFDDLELMLQELDYIY